MRRPPCYNQEILRHLKTCNGTKVSSVLCQSSQKVHQNYNITIVLNQKQSMNIQNLRIVVILFLDMFHSTKPTNRVLKSFKALKDVRNFVCALVTFGADVVR